MSHIYYPTCRYGTRHVYFPCHSSTTYSNSIIHKTCLVSVGGESLYVAFRELLTKFPFGDGFCDSLAVICANILHLTSTLLLISLLLMEILRHGFIHGTRTVGSMMLPPGVIVHHWNAKRLGPMMHPSLWGVGENSRHLMRDEICLDVMVRGKFSHKSSTKITCISAGSSTCKTIEPATTSWTLDLSSR
ncbi:hypothetical protein GOBAR_DD20221 [Gossypium barbadense]|nr:hypothetical protein GOBAR_DD20221 [Gossypium barbadense]